MTALMLAAGSVTGLARCDPEHGHTNSAASPGLTAEYPDDPAGVLIESSGWTEIAAAARSKSRVKRGLAASLSHGAVPAAVVAEYQGQHAQVVVTSHQPIICICHPASLPAAPALVKLHAKKGYRELDGGRLPILGGKDAETKKNDLVPVEVSQLEKDVWLVRPRNALTAGEYALMLGTQNVSIFPFTISGPATDSTAPGPVK